MKTQTDKTREQQSDAAPKIQQEPGTGGTATITDNRPATVYQRKLRETMNAHAASKALPVQRKTPKGSSRFQQIATAMGDKHGVDTSGLVATHNSSFPAQLNAEATIQGHNIHFAPGMDTHYNIRHEVAHAIDNTLNGTPKGDRVVNGQKIDTTREKVVDRMAKAPVMQCKGKVSINDGEGLEKKAGTLGRVSGDGVIQRIHKVVVGEDHGDVIAELEEETPQPGGNPVRQWSEEAQLSKVVAALISRNQYVPPADYLVAFNNEITAGNAQALMQEAGTIWAGGDPRWGAENNIMGQHSLYIKYYRRRYNIPRNTINNWVTPQNNRTHIEDPEIRAVSSFLREMSGINGGETGIETLAELYRHLGGNTAQNLSVRGALYSLQNNAQNRLARKRGNIRAVNNNTQVLGEWAQLDQAGGLWRNRHQPQVQGLTNRGAVGGVADRLASYSWATQMDADLETGYAQLLRAAQQDILLRLPQNMQGIFNTIPGATVTATVGTIRASKYSRKSIGLQRMHATVSLSRTLTQLAGMERNDRAYTQANAAGPNFHLGYIVGDSHLEDIVALTANDPTSPVFQSLDPKTIVRRADYDNLRRYLQGLIGNPARQVLQNHNDLLIGGYRL